LGNLIQEILFSDFTIIAMIGLAILAITGWARVLREWAGYLLGWLAGIFFILVLSTLFPLPIAPPPGTPVAPVQNTLTFFELIIPSILGLIVGFGVMLAIRLVGTSDLRVWRALIVAGLLSFALTAGYLLLRTNIADRWGLAVFALTFAIGALLNFIFTRGASRNLVSGI